MYCYKFLIHIDSFIFFSFTSHCFLTHNSFNLPFSYRFISATHGHSFKLSKRGRVHLDSSENSSKSHIINSRNALTVVSANSHLPLSSNLTSFLPPFFFFFQLYKFFTLVFFHACKLHSDGISGKYKIKVKITIK